MDRSPGLSVRTKLTLSYAGFLTATGAVLLAVTWYFLLRQRSILYIPAPADFRLILSPGNFGPRVFSPAAVAALVFMLLVGLIGGWILAGRMLAPLARITNAARQAEGGALSYRIQLEGRRDELRELADAFDAMLARLEARDAEQRRFAANASHELRTPLAITQTLLEVARQDPSREFGELDERLYAVNTRAIELTEALLLLSRTDQRGFLREPVDISLVAEETTETLLPLAEKHDVAVQNSGEVAIALGSPTLLLQLTTNLVHNAIVHNLPAGGWVRIHTAREPGFTLLTVENTGPMLSAHLVDTLTEPFRRGTERIRGDSAGVGLGLAIASSIARSHDGALNLVPRPDGGLFATVRLRAARSGNIDNTR